MPKQVQGLCNEAAEFILMDAVDTLINQASQISFIATGIAEGMRTNPSDRCLGGCAELLMCHMEILDDLAEKIHRFDQATLKRKEG